MSCPVSWVWFQIQGFSHKNCQNLYVTNFVSQTSEKDVQGLSKPSSQILIFFPFAPFFYLCHWFNNRLLALWPMSRTFPTKFFLRCDVWRLVALGYRRTRRVELYVNPPFDDWVSFSRDQCKSRSFGLASGNKSKDVRQTITDYSAKGEIMSRISFFIPFFLSFFLS